MILFGNLLLSSSAIVDLPAPGIPQMPIKQYSFYCIFLTIQSIFRYALQLELQDFYASIIINLRNIFQIKQEIDYKCKLVIKNKNTFLMSISLSVYSSVIIEFVSEVFIPVLDKNNPNFSLCIKKWEEFRQTVIKRILNFQSVEQLRQRVKQICKIEKQQKLQKYSDKRTQNLLLIDHFSQSKGSQDQKSNQQRSQSYKKNNLQWPKQDSINFRNRKISTDETQGRRQNRQHSQILLRKQERSNSFYANGLQNDIFVQVPLLYGQGHQPTQKSKNLIPGNSKRQNEVLSFNSISEFHKSRKNIPLTSKQVKDNQINAGQQQMNLLSKKSIDDTFVPSISQSRPNSYSTNYIESIKKINIESQSPSSKSKPFYPDMDTSQDYVETTPIRGHESENLTISMLESIKKRISDGTDYMTSPQIGTTDSFSKFLSSFKKLCTTFESNHQKLLRQDFNNKYVNC